MSSSSLQHGDFNDFARGLTARFADRAVGLDQSSARLLNIRPSDHVLAGFLTASGGNDVDDLDDDLPKDSPYQQSSMGFEWLTPIDGVDASEKVDIELSFYVYVRRLPRFEELQGAIIWRHRQEEGGPIDERGKLPFAWSREGPFELTCQVHLRQLLDERVCTVSLADALHGGIQAIVPAGLFPGRRALSVGPKDVASPESYQTWIGSHAQAATSLPDWLPQIDARVVAVPTSAKAMRIALRVVNKTDKVTKLTQLDFIDPSLYGVRLKASLPERRHQRSMFGELPASFRYDRSMAAIGINAQAAHSREPGRVVLQTQAVACVETPRLVPRVIARAVPTFQGLMDAPESILDAILMDMRRYAGEDWPTRVRELAGEEALEARLAMEAFGAETARFEEGVRLLSNPNYPHVRRAFALMNEAMARAAPQHKEWRLFQIVFIVSNLRELAAREYPELASAEDGKVDILWFAAGGGKTEAFLGLILWQAFFDRLRTKSFGTAAVVRFPLRLLGFQQFQRIGRALAQAELLRMREKLGGARFSLGFFVGSQVTPNAIDDAMHARLRQGDIDPRLQRVLSCPFCNAQVVLGYDAPLRLLEHRCTSEECPGGKGRLPMYIIDADVYRFLPTVLVATVDKFALLGQNQRFANILGRVDVLCHYHGASFSKTNRDCEAAKALAGGNVVESCGTHEITRSPFHDLSPSLLVQDEMHLLSEELGAFDAHYETAIDRAIEDVGGRGWKIVGASATIEGYERHAWQLYQRHSQRFPAPGPQAEQSFYYEPAVGRLGRLFVGLLGVGRKHTPIVARALSLLYLELEHARQLAETSPTAFSDTYGVRNHPTNDLMELVFRYEIPLTYVLTRKGSDQVSEAIESRVKKELEQSNSGHYLDVRTFNSGVDMVDMIGTMERIQKATHETSPSERIRGVVATSIIGHGVDVDRFNVMVFAGFTRLVAEYIQASARVGRTFPGISILVVTPQSERDRSVFERFDAFHRYVDRLVDPSALNRWSESALSRTVAGVLCGYLFCVAAQALRRPLATVEDVQNAATSNPKCLQQDEVVRWLKEAYGVSHAPSPGYANLVEAQTKNKLAYVLNSPPASGSKVRNLGKHLGSMRSLRDVDEPASIRVGEPEEVLKLRRLING